MIAINNISFEFGGRYLYKNASWHIKPNERIGLIGLNGTGKSTLLRVINGEYSLGEGSISKPKGLTIGFLNQDHLSFEIDDTILNVAMAAFQRQLDLEAEIEELIVKLETDHSDSVINELSDKQTEFESLDGYNIRHKCEKVLEGLGFTTQQLGEPFKKFSGGWRMRVILAKMLLQNPDLLMLDEPTNHLDLPTIEWLEDYLKTYSGTVIIVSHDREFLDRIINKTVEISLQNIFEYSGNYSFFLTAKEERTRLQQRQYENQQQYIKEQEKFINRFRAKATKAAAAQSRIKQLDKLERIESPEDDNREINIKFRMSQNAGRFLCEIENASKSYPGVNIIEKANGIVERGDKIALIGANGKGKSTLLRIIAGAETCEGKIISGHNTIKAFYAQHQLDSLSMDNTLIEELQHNSVDRTDNELRTILGCFLFSGDDVFKKIRVLSGGEKARVALAKTLLTEANFLLLDEPTNHLDIRSTNILVQALQQYNGTFLVVSHDRFFVNSIANKIWWLEDGQIKEYPGTFSEYEYWRQKQIKEKSKLKVETKPAEKRAKVVEDVKKADVNKPSNNFVQNLNKRFNEYEKKIADLKVELKKIELDFLKPEITSDNFKIMELHKLYEAEKSALVHLEKEHLAVVEELINLEDSFSK